MNTPRAARASSSNDAAVGIKQNPGNAAPARAVRKLAPPVAPKVTPALRKLALAAELQSSRGAAEAAATSSATSPRRQAYMSSRSNPSGRQRRPFGCFQNGALSMVAPRDCEAELSRQPMPMVLATFLRKLIARRPADDLLFASPRAKSGRVYQASTIFAPCVERAGLGRNITPHTLRHTAATNAAHAGLDSATIHGLGGRKTRAMADRYTHAANLNAAMDALGAQLAGRTTPKLHQASQKRR